MPGLDQRNGAQGTQAKDSDPIVVVGLAIRLPQNGNSVRGFWEMVQNGSSASTEIPGDKINIDAFYNPNGERPDTCNVRKGNFLKGDLAAFDAPFFSIQPIEAESMDPQQRMLLETTYQALENAGQKLADVSGSNTSVFVAASNRDYEVMQYRDPEQLPKYMGTGIGSSLLSNRLSWFFNCRGPSVMLDTACSGSLTAVHLACQSLYSNETEMALVGGTSLILSPDANMTQLSTLGFLSPDGISYSFDERANGYAKGEGTVVIVLKRLSCAIKNNDTIRAVIRTTSVNQDGRTPGITQPSKSAQTANIQKAYKQSHLTLEETTYFEAHGTGTAMGDPIEAEAIYNAFKRDSNNPLYIGSLKANIGHLEAAAGIAAFVKSVIVLEKGILPPNAHHRKTNKNIPAEKWGLKFLHEAIKFPAMKNGLRRISINSFGYGGTNAHVVLDDAASFASAYSLAIRHSTLADPTTIQASGGTHSQESNGFLNNSSSAQIDSHNDVESSSKNPVVLLWSAADEAGIKRVVDTYTSHFRDLAVSKNTDGWRSNDYLRNLAYTLCQRRTNLPWKSYSLVYGIGSFKDDSIIKQLPTFRSSLPPLVSFIFTGQGAQWSGMARGLEFHASFRDSLQKSESLLDEIGCEWSLTGELAKHSSVSRIDDPDLSQPVCTAIQIALVDLLRSWNISPVAVVGHSSGEIAAAYCVDALSHSSAIKIAYYRGKVVSNMSKAGGKRGAMLSVALSEQDVMEYIESNSEHGGVIEVGCVNSPSNITLTGDVPAIDEMHALMESRHVFAKKLPIGVAYHSSHMKSVAAEYLNSIKSLMVNVEKPVSSNITMVSSVTGEIIKNEQLASPEYWVENLVSKVQFLKALDNLIELSIARRTIGEDNLSRRDVFVEIGPHSALQRPFRDTMANHPTAEHLDYEQSLSRQSEPLISLANLAGRLCCRGCRVDIMAQSFGLGGSPNVQVLSSLPQYPFDHSKTFWAENRYSKNQRFRKYPRHDLLGSQDRDWNVSKPRWRNLIRMAEHPWIREHKFGKSGLYPGAGLLVMAIEGTRQLVANNKSVVSFTFNNITFATGFVVPSESDIMEAQLYLDSIPSFNEQVSSNYEFAVFGLIHDVWKEVCKGSISLELSLENQSHNAENSKLNQNGICDQSTNYSTNMKWDRVNVEKYYDSLAEMGYSLGPSFQSLAHLKFNHTGEARAKLKLDRWTTVAKNFMSSEYVIHPVNLDALFQSTIIAQSQGASRHIPILLPSLIKSIWISNKLIEHPPETELDVSVVRTFQGFREGDFDIEASAPNGELVVVAKGFRQTSISTDPLDGGSSSTSRRLNYLVDWKPDLALAEPIQIYQMCDIGNFSKAPSEEFVDKQELVSMFFLKHALETVPINTMSEASKHLKKYMDWAREKFDKKRFCSLRSSINSAEPLFGDNSERDKWLNDFCDEGPEAKIIVTIGRKLTAILRGEVDALTLLFSNSLASDFYASSTFSLPMERITPYIDLLAHKNPSLRVLEIGAGTGGATAHALRCLSSYTEYSTVESDVQRYQEYMFTDISPAFFEEARSKFGAYPKVQYATLNIEDDPCQQGFTEGHYDLIICSAVLHATANLHNTLRNVRRLLKPEGKLILIELSPEPIRVAFVFGLLPGWWLGSEEYRVWSPCVSIEKWDELFRATGFSGTDLVLKDHSDPQRFNCSTLVTSAEIPADPPQANASYSIVAFSGSNLQMDIGNRLLKYFERTPSQAKIVNIEGMLEANFSGMRCIVLLELDTAFFDSIEENTWQAYKRLVTTAASVVWVTTGSGQIPSEPLKGLTAGITRHLPSEHPESLLTLINIEDIGSSDALVRKIIKVDKQTNFRKHSMAEPEYTEIGNELCIPRLLPNTVVNRKIQDSASGGQSRARKFGADARSLSLTISNPGFLNTLQFQDDAVYDEPLGSLEVEIETMATSVSSKDVDIAMGRKADNRLGFECSGIVTRSGENSEFRKGDKVCGAVLTGAFKTYVRADSSSLISMPSYLSFAEAAAVPTALFSAFYALAMRANLQPEETVLVLSGATDLGQAAIRIAKLSKAKLLTTVGDQEQHDIVRRLFDIPESQIFMGFGAETFKTIQRRMQHKIDVTFIPHSDYDLEALCSILNQDGRLVEICDTGTPKFRRQFSRVQDFHNISFSSVNLEAIMKASKALMRRITRGVEDMFKEEAHIDPPYPLTTFGISRVDDAVRHMDEKRSIGKVVVEIDKSETVQVLPSKKPSYLFDSTATYVIAGGLGGLGRSIVTWMSQRQARHFLLLSRSGGEQGQAREWIDQMRQAGLSIEAPKCDITDTISLASALESSRSVLPPIKGCIQATMVLKDGILDNMSSDDFNRVLEPKTKGTINLSRFLPEYLDFFVLLSSIAGVTGSRGQANYAAANTFQDAFARQRVSQGKHCISLNLGAVLSIGYAAERNLEASLRRSGFEGVRKEEFFALLEYCCDPKCPAATNPRYSQIVSGLAGAETFPVEHFNSIYWASRPIFSLLRQLSLSVERSSQSKESESSQKSPSALLAAAKNQQAATEIALNAVVDRIAKLLAVPVADIDSRTPLSSFSLDSLVTIEIRHWINRELGTELNMLEIMETSDLEDLAKLIISRRKNSANGESANSI